VKLAVASASPSIPIARDDREGSAQPA
jgi:hypothetical protein